MGPRTDNTIVVIPSYNEGRTIGNIVKDISLMGYSVLVIDDGSVDNTEREALDNGAMVIRNKENIGKGSAVIEGIRHVHDKMNYKWMILMDGDGQHHPEDIPALVCAARYGDVDIVVGNRMTQTRTMPSARYWTNRFTSWVVSVICGQKIPDSQCGFRLLRVEALKEVELMSERYDIESEMLIEAARNKHRIISAPIKTIYGNETSQIHPVRDTIRFFGLVFRYFFKK